MGSHLDIRNEGGAALVMAMGVMTIMIIIGILVITLSLNTTKTVGHDIRVTEAQNVAEAGVDKAIAVATANYSEVYPGGIPDYPGDGMPMFSDPQELLDSQGNVLGTYEVWTKQDPDRPDNALITATGTMAGESSDTSTVRVSVSFIPSIFDYALLVGDAETAYDSHRHGSRTYRHGGYSWGDHNYDAAACGPRLRFDLDANDSNVTVVGNVHVNGEMDINTGWGWHSNSGTVSFLDRDGSDDTATYSCDYGDGGNPPEGNQPVQSDEVEFPVVDFDAFTNRIDVVLDDDNVPAGWTCDDGGWGDGGWGDGGWGGSSCDGNYSISAADFENLYGAYEVVAITTTSDSRRADIDINGTGDDSNPAVITSTIMLPAGDSEAMVDDLYFNGPGLSLQPDNGIAILTAEGDIRLDDGVAVGLEGAGALIYVTEQSHHSRFEARDGVTIYGSVVVSAAEVEFEVGRDYYYSGRDSWYHRDHWHSWHGHHHHQSGDDIVLAYDSAYMNNPNLPSDWWDEGTLTAHKENYERD